MKHFHGWRPVARSSAKTEGLLHVAAQFAANGIDRQIRSSGLGSVLVFPALWRLEQLCLLQVGIAMTVEIRELREEDAVSLAASLREMDRLEVMAMAPGRKIEDVLIASLRASRRGRAGFWNGRLVACWGVAPRSQCDGAPWLLATDAIDEPAVRRAFIRHGADEMKRLCEGFRCLWNLVHRDNALARRWLHFMGFEFRDKGEYLVSGEPFVRFDMELS